MKTLEELKEEFKQHILDEFEATTYNNKTMLQIIDEVRQKIKNSEIRK